ncbi:hypothetical protein N7481_000673 [Penicillium waksmanii]|uniref:uncharacterized protein n=1 Tax=Penicillium waksmanii TaxID=69791 RepID=UPI0025467778|nr:uncharacterized protein N7481_000673 [Penicillium waksmanii]KAJ6000264.1 hypothetical protein N7481_000673 [Penicillium waksmanii]
MHSSHYADETNTVAKKRGDSFRLPKKRTLVVAPVLRQWTNLPTLQALHLQGAVYSSNTKPNALSHDRPGPGPRASSTL